MKTTLRQLRALIAEAAKGQFMTCMFDWEGDLCAWFVKGNEQACHAAAQQMATLLGTHITDKQEIENDPGEADGCPIVLPAGDPLIKGTAITTVEHAFGDSYDAGSSVMISYPDLAADMDPTGFQPIKKTRFKPGDKVILAVFIPSSPGAWIVTDTSMTVREHWQEGTIDNTYPEDEPGSQKN